MLADAAPAPSRWDDAASDIAALLEDRTCVVMVGERDEDAARVALALAQTHARTRRVAIVDAVGELSPLQKLLPRDAGPHGVIDHFVHGVSLRKVAYPVNRDRTLFVVPSGVGPFEYSTLLRRERWRRLTMAFRTQGALLLVVLPRDAEGLVGFVEDTDGVVLVGDVDYAEPRQVIANVWGTGRPSADAGVVPTAPTPKTSLLARWTRKAPSKRAVLIGIGVAVAVVGALAWVTRPPSVDAASRTSPDVVGGAQTQQTGALVVNEDDADDAALYSVEVVMVNNLHEAGRHLRDRLAAVPMATFSPVRLGADSARWYRLLVGAWSKQREADSALAALRGAGVLQMGLGSIRRTPFAVRLADGVSPSSARSRASELRAQGFPAYALGRDEDHASVYAGAFETPSQAIELLDMFMRAGIDATVAYRIGRGI